MNDAAIVLTKDEIKNILSGLMKKSTVYAPISNGKKIDFLQVSDVEQIIFSDELPYKSPKELFFPRCEKMITFKGGEAIAEAPEESLVLFGARPCDLEALDIMKTIFTEGKFRDPLFENRYDNALMIGTGCMEKKPGCFCDERETDKGFSGKCDLFLGRNGECYEVMHVSEKAKAALGGDIPGLDAFENTAHAFKPEKTISISATEEELFNRIDWENIIDTCQGCGLCTFVCPTCHCFMFKDVDEGECAYRYRNWDSCMYPKFTMHASGHNPRAAKHERYRQRLAHKYLYIKENFGMTGCTGCGRCVRGCPAGFSIKTVAEGIMEVLK